jgi:hypothetical protein
MCILIFFANFAGTFFHSKKEWARYHQKCIFVFMWSIREFPRDDFRKMLKYKISLNPPGGSRFVPCGRTEGGTDRHDKTNSRFSHFCKRVWYKEHVQLVIDKLYYRVLILHPPTITICTTSLTLHNCTFCPHNVFMCFVWISEQTAIISQYSINWLVCVTEK